MAHSELIVYSPNVSAVDFIRIIGNSLPPQIRQAPTLVSFKRHLKTYLLTEAFGLTHIPSLESYLGYLENHYIKLQYYYYYNYHYYYQGSFLIQ